MATDELKLLLHRQIDRLDDPQDVQDLLLTVSEFIGQRTNVFTETPELQTQLAKTLATISTAQLTPHNDVAKQAKQWITR
ncbi:hypothetical protein [uncultured Spirosoma sp.]|uniref:hypothetical protein n=1 Tax=uncultured Spirosoma sp. TaxID=278208 RepID=UPI002590A2D2|nr:hypothetical protein [uncultured Spirosoma sp.]